MYIIESFLKKTGFFFFYCIFHGVLDNVIKLHSPYKGMRTS